MIILAIDQSSNKCGYAVFDKGELFEHGNVTLINDKSDYSRYVAMKTWITDMLDVWKPDIVATEDCMSLARVNPRICRTLMITFTAMLASCGARDIQFLYLSPSNIKKVMTGKGNAKKDVVRECVNKKFKENIQSEDECDAIAIGVTALSLIVK